MQPSAKEPLQLEALLRSTHPFGRYQKSRLLVIGLILAVFSASAHTLTTLLIFTPEHRCHVGNVTIEDLDRIIPMQTYHGELTYSKCKIFVKGSNLTETCPDGYDYFGDVQRTISAEFNLVCERGVFKSAILGIQMFLFRFGMLIYGFASDRFGRKRALFSSCLVWSLATIGAAFIRHFWVFTVVWIVSFLSGGASYVVPNVFGNELVTNDHRPLVNGMFEVLFSTWGGILGGLCYWLADWRLTAKVVGGAGLACTLATLFLDESPRWLLTAGKNRDALDVLEKISRINGAGLTRSDIRLSRQSSKASVAILDHNNQDQTGFWCVIKQVLMKTHLRRKAAVIFSMFFCCNSMLFGLPIAVQLIKVNPYALCAIQTSAAAVPALFSTYLVKYTGRMRGYFIVTVICGLACVVTGIPPNSAAMAAAVAAIISRAFVGGSYALYYLISAEILPTEIRSIVQSIVRSACAFFLAGVPFLYLYLGDELDMRWLPFTFNGGLIVLTSTFVLYLPETTGLPLTDTVEESEQQLPVVTANLSRNLGCIGGTYEEEENLEALVKT